MLQEVVEQAESLGLQFVVGPEDFGLLLAFARITGVLHTAPLISSRNVPVLIRLGLAGCLAVILSPILVIASGDGPIQINPASITACAKSARSERRHRHGGRPGLGKGPPCIAHLS